MEKVGFFGGSFNPPTNMHIHLATKLIEDKLIEKLVFVPVGDYYKKQSLATAVDRLNMLNLACKGLNNIEVDNIASSHEKMLYATDTFELIANKYKGVDIYFIMGSDNFKKMPSWKNYDEIINKYKFIVIERPDYEETSNLENVITYKIEQPEDMSSTKMRNMLKQGKDTSAYLNKNVIEYILKHKLYYAIFGK